MDYRATIVVFRIGQIGDTVVALPALWSIREAFPDARIILLSNASDGNGESGAAAVVRGTGLCDEAVVYVPSSMPSVFRRLSRERAQVAVHLPPSCRSPWKIARDRAFFRLCGVRRLLGFHGQKEAYPRLPSGRLARVPHEADYLLSLLARDGLAVPGGADGGMDLALTGEERATVDEWVERSNVPRGRPWVAFGPASPMQAKRWPSERFAEVGRRLVRERGMFPIVFGGRGDAALGDKLLASWKTGANAAVTLSVREAAECIRRCALYVGNDTGTMHLAAAVRTPCVAVFSSRENPGRWEPYGNGHRVLRSSVACDGCMRTRCGSGAPPCLARITVDEVFDACCESLARSRPRLDASVQR